MKQDIKTEDAIRGEVHKNLPHESAQKHVCGQADYTDDIREPIGTLHAYLGLSDVATQSLSILIFLPVWLWRGWSG